MSSQIVGYLLTLRTLVGSTLCLTESDACRNLSIGTTTPAIGLAIVESDVNLTTLTLCGQSGEVGSLDNVVNERRQLACGNLSIGTEGSNTVVGTLLSSSDERALSDVRAISQNKVLCIGICTGQHRDETSHDVRLDGIGPEGLEVG